MYRKLEDFVTVWKEEEELTVTIFSKVNDNAISHQVTENIRSLGCLAWHITQTLTEMPYKAGIVEKDSLEDKPVPPTFSEIINTYRLYSKELIGVLKEKWTDYDLDKKIEIYGQEWEKRKILLVLINHQIHHRAQMTILMRLQNLEVPGIYGPSKEEWSKYGMDPQL
ncbi:DinB family protein [Bacteroidota bacterium]